MDGKIEKMERDWSAEATAGIQKAEAATGVYFI
jgi:hypothetical protein